MNNNISVHLSALSGLNTKKSIGEGSSVYVRILKDNGNGSYIASFSSGRFLLKSDVPLLENSGFRARIKIDGEKVLLQRIAEKAELKNNVQKITSENKNIFFERLSLPSDRLSFILFQQSRLLGGKFDVKTFDKARHIAEKLKKNKNAAGNAAYIMEKKGISSDEKKVLSILDESDDFEDLDDFFDSQKNTDFLFLQDSSYDKKDCKAIENLFQSFFLDIFTNPESFGLKPSALTLFNHLGFCFNKENATENSFLTDGSWIKIPFDFILENKNGKGSFCAFIKNDSCTLKKATITFSFEEEMYAFSLDFCKEKLSSINCACTNLKKTESLLRKLKNRFNDVSVSFSELKKEDFSEFSAENVQINMVDFSI